MDNDEFGGWRFTEHHGENGERSVHVFANWVDLRLLRGPLRDRYGRLREVIRQDGHTDPVARFIVEVQHPEEGKILCWIDFTAHFWKRSLQRTFDRYGLEADNVHTALWRFRKVGNPQDESSLAGLWKGEIIGWDKHDVNSPYHDPEDYKRESSPWYDISRNKPRRLWDFQAAMKHYTEELPRGEYVSELMKVFGVDEEKAEKMYESRGHVKLK